MKRLVSLLAVAGSLLGACGAQPGSSASTAEGLPAATGVSPTSAAAVAGGRYETVTAVLESPDHGPELCLSGILDSSPPLCGDVPITNWDWQAVQGEQTVNSTTWVEGVYVSGIYDGTTFTLDRVRTATDDDRLRFTEPPPDFHAPCAPPVGGWLAAAAGAGPDAELSGDGAIAAYVAGQADGGGWWVDNSINPNTPEMGDDPRALIVVASFTGDLARHEADLRSLWSGALCVTQAKYSASALLDLAVKVTAGMHDGSLLTLPDGSVLHVFGFSDSGNVLTGTVDLDVMIADPLAQRWYDDTYGPGRVVLRGVLRPMA